VIAMLASFWGFPLFTDSHHGKPTRAAPPGLILHTFEGITRRTSFEQKAA